MYENLQNQYNIFRRNTDIEWEASQPRTNNRRTLRNNLDYRMDQLNDFEQKMYGELQDYGFSDYQVMEGGDENTYERDYVQPRLDALTPALDRFATAKKQQLKAQHTEAALLHLRHLIRRKQADPSTAMGRRYLLRTFNNLAEPPGAHLPSLNNVPLRQRLGIHRRERERLADIMPLAQRVLR